VRSSASLRGSAACRRWPRLRRWVVGDVGTVAVELVEQLRHHSYSCTPGGSPSWRAGGSHRDARRAAHARARRALVERMSWSSVERHEFLRVWTPSSPCRAGVHPADHVLSNRVEAIGSTRGCTAPSGGQMSSMSPMGKASSAPYSPVAHRSARLPSQVSPRVAVATNRCTRLARPAQHRDRSARRSVR